jgi:hypothetical protein
LELKKMGPALSLGRGLLLTSVLVATACSDMNLSRVRRPLADTVEPGNPPKPAPTSKEAPLTDAAAAKAAFGEIRQNLRRLVVSEETFFAENGTYSDDLPHIGFKSDSTTPIRFLWHSRDSWAASGTHVDLLGRDCVVFLGQTKRRPTTLKHVRAVREGTPVCDDGSPPPLRPATPATPEVAAPAKPDTTPPDTANALDMLDPRVLMKVDLWNLARSQEAFFQMQGFYARRAENLALQYLWHKGVQVKVLAADAESWVAKATNARLPGRSCVIWSGPVAHRPVTDAQRRGETRPGVPVCDE